MRKRLTLDQRGTTLVDLIIAIALLAMAVAAAGIFATAATRIGSEAGRRTQATALASRELEGLRSYRDFLLKDGQPWPFQGDQGSRDPQDCEKFVMRRAGSGWQMQRVTSGGPVPYTARDENNDTQYEEQFGDFSRLVTACDAPEYQPGAAAPGNYSGANSNIKRIEAKVYWQEQNGQIREVSFDTVMTNWGSDD